MTPSLVIAGLALGIWLYLILFRGGFWLARERDQDEAGIAASLGLAEAWLW